MPEINDLAKQIKNDIDKKDSEILPQKINISSPSKSKVADINFSSYPVEQQSKPEVIKVDAEEQLLTLSMLISYVAIHGTIEEKKDLLRCIGLIYKFDGYENYVEKVVAMLKRYQEEDISFFDLYKEIPTIDQTLVEAEVQRYKQNNQEKK